MAVAIHQNLKPVSSRVVRSLHAPAPSAPQLRDAPSLHEVHFDAGHGVLWVHMKADAPSKFTPEVVADLRQRQMDTEERIRRELASGVNDRVRYQVLASRHPQIFSLGGDLGLFRRLIADGDREGLTSYARSCVDLVYVNAVNYNLPVTTISLVQGTAPGGGMEAALAANVVIAERGVKMGLPEVMFNLFPGMGAYQLLSRRVPPAEAERIILSGRTFLAEELHERGIVDVIAEPGHGEEAVREYIRTHHDRLRGHHGLRRAMQASNPMTHEEFVRFVDVWVDQAFSLGERDLKIMDHLVRAQSRVAN